MSILLKVDNLSKKFPVKKGLFGSTDQYVHAVNNVSFELLEGETLGVVGESGCGKTTLANMIIGLLNPTQGEIYFDNKNITEYKKKSEIKELRSNMQMIFQDPYSSLNPHMTIEEIITEPIVIHKKLTKKEIHNKAIELLGYVGMSESDLSRMPSEFSGGQRQRIGIARAIALNPKFIVCDEPVSALDMSIHAQILNLLNDLQNKLNLSYFFISHNLAVVKHVSDKVMIMYLGHIVEYGTADDIFNNPKHSYTKALLGVAPYYSNPKNRKQIILEGEIPSPINLPKGCPFSSRCPNCMDKCTKIKPCIEYIDNEHYVACHRYSSSLNI